MTKILLKAGLFTAAVSLFLACEEEIPWDTETIDPYLVVDARIDDSLQQQKVLLTKTVDYFAPTSPSTVEDATVSVRSGDEVHTFRHAGSGMYLSDDAFKGIPGQTYELTIDLPYSLNEESHFTASGVMPRPLQVNELTPIFIDPPFGPDTNEDIVLFNTETGVHDTIVDLKEMFLILMLAGKEPEGENSYYRYRLNVNKYAITEHYSDSYITTDEGWDGAESFSLQGVAPVVDGDTVALEIHAITKQEYRYISDLQSEINGSDPLGMSGDPANVEGNISGGAIGCFRLSAITRISEMSINGDVYGLSGGVK